MNREEDQNSSMSAAGPVLAGLYGVLSESADFYFSAAYSEAARAEHTDRAVANNIYSHAERRVRSLAEQTPSLSIIVIRGLVVANYNDAALFRFKKVRPNGQHSNYQTQQQQNYDDQLSFAELPEPAVRLTVGYELDAAGAGLKGIMVARPIGRSIFWTAKVVMENDNVRWEDITPSRFLGTGDSDFDADRARSRRRG